MLIAAERATARLVGGPRGVEDPPAILSGIRQKQKPRTRRAKGGGREASSRTGRGRAEGHGVEREETGVGTAWTKKTEQAGSSQRERGIQTVAAHRVGITFARVSSANPTVGRVDFRSVASLDRVHEHEHGPRGRDTEDRAREIVHGRSCTEDRVTWTENESRAREVG